MPQAVTFTANRMDLGLDLNSPRNLKPGQISEGIAVRVEKGSGMYTGNGYEQVKDLGTATSVYPFEATVFPILWVKSGTAITYSSDPDTGTFYGTGLTRTAAEIDAFIEQGNGDILLTNQTDTNTRIAVSTVAAIDSGAGTFSVRTGDGSKFSSGTVYIRGVAITGGTLSTDDYTGCSNLTAAMAVGDIVVQTSEPATWTEEKCAFGFEFESRMVLGAQVNKEHILSASAPEDENNPQFFYDFDGNGQVKRIMQGKLVGGIKGIGRAFIFTDRQIHQLSGFDVTTGAFLMTPLSEHYGAYNPRCIVDMDGIVAFLGRGRLIPVTIKLSPDGTVPSLDEEFDAPLRPWLDQLDDASKQSIANLSYNSVTKLLKISAKRNGALETYVYDRHAGIFLGKENRPITGSAMFNGYSYFGTNGGTLCKDDFGFTNNGIAIAHRFSTGRLEYDKGRREMQARTFEHDGFMQQGTEFTVRAYLDGSSEPAYEHTFDDSLITSTAGITLGTRGVGSGTISNGDSMTVYPMKNPIILRDLSAEDYRFEWEVSGDGMFLQVNSWSFEAFLLSRSARTYA